MNWDEVASPEIIDKTIENLKKNGINAEVVANGEEALRLIESTIPKRAQVMTMTSVTLKETGIRKLIDASGEYESVKNLLKEMDGGQVREKRQLGAAPDWAVGSVHAVTEDGQVMVASNTGSQLPAYVYGAEHVVWIVGAQKIVKDLDAGMKRIQDYILPLETERARKAYKLPDTYHSFVSKVLIFNREVNKERLHLIFVNEKLGF